MKKREISYTAGRNVNWCSLSGKHYGGSLKNKVLYIFIVYNILSTIYSVYTYMYIYIYTHIHIHYPGASQMAQRYTNKPDNAGDVVWSLGFVFFFFFFLPPPRASLPLEERSLGFEQPLGKEMVTYTSILTGIIPEIENLQSMRLQRVRHNWATVHPYTHA